MTQAITVRPTEQGSAIVTITLADEDDNALVFAQLTNPAWQLMQADGTVVNDRTFALCTMTSLTFALTGDDLAAFGRKDLGTRILSFQAFYDSSVATGLAITAECSFKISKLLGQVDQ